MPESPETFVWQLKDTVTKKIINIYKSKIILGRRNDADIICTFVAASRAHAEFSILDGQLTVVDLKSLNGTFVNKQKILSMIPRVLIDGDEVAIGEVGPVTDEHKCFTVGRMTSSEIITLEISDDEDEDTSHKEGPLLNDKNESPCDSVETKCIEQSDENKEVAGQKVEQNEPSSSANKEETKNNVRNGQFSKKKVDEKSVTSINDLERHQLANEPKAEQLQCLDEEIIVIMDDDDDDVAMLSQVLAVQESPAGERPRVTDDIFDKIKKEVAEFDYIDCQEYYYPCVLGSEQENENLSDIFADELKAYNANKQNDPSPPSPTAVSNESVHVSHSNVENLSEIFTDELKEPTAVPNECVHVSHSNVENLSEIFIDELKESHVHVSHSNEFDKQSSSSSSSPLAAPPVNGNMCSERFYKRASTVLIEAQPLKIQNGRKRKSNVKKIEEPTKKQKRYSNLEKNLQDIQDQSKRKKKTEIKLDDTRACKEQKKKIAEKRKEKLKELVTKSTENKSSESKSRINKPKVKVSEGRGNFLLSDIEAVPSTSKAKDIQPKPIMNSRIVSRRPTEPTKAVSEQLKAVSEQAKPVNEQEKPVLRPQLTNKTVRVDTTDEVKEILSWKAHWLTKHDSLTHLNPVVRLKKLKPLEHSYSCYNEYFEMNRSLLMVELWAHLQKEFEVNRSNCVFPMFVEDCEHDSRADIWILNCLTYLTKIQAESLTSVRESDLLVVDLRLARNGRAVLKPGFGFIQDCTRCTLRNHHYINTSLAGILDSVPHTKISLKVLINKCSEELKTKSIVNFKILTSLVSHLRLFKSLRYLEHSPLINIVLKPRAKDFTLPDVTKDTLIAKDNLSTVQLHAVMEAVCVCSRSEPGLYLIQGPPGTGKTNVIKNIVLQLLYGKHKIQDGCILLVAPSNAAVDQLVLKLVYETRPKLTDDQKKNMKLVRVGPESSIHTKVKPHCLEVLAKRNLKKDLLLASTEATERYKELQRAIELQETEIQKLRAKNMDVTHLKTKLESLKNRNDNFAKDLLRDKYNQEISQNADTLLCGANVICTTLSSCMGRRIEENVLSGKLRFACCIVDEATQSTEQESLIPLRLGVERMVLVGDPQQLPATVMSSDAKLLGYGCSLFQRILKNFSNLKSKPLKILNRQYRMHPAICKFPNKQYYDGKLESSFRYSKPLQSLKPFLIFSLNAPFNNYRKQEMYKNTDEACFIHKLIEALLDTIPKCLNVSVGIITPYQNQRTTIHSMLKSVKYRDDVSIECNTVDSFQGQETDIAILSCVREAANTFLNDAHRLNVALTRAKYALYVVGTKSLFDSCAELVRLRQNAEERKLLKDGTHLKCNDLKRVLWK